MRREVMRRERWLEGERGAEAGGCGDVEEEKEKVRVVVALLKRVERERTRFGDEEEREGRRSSRSATRWSFRLEYADEGEYGSAEEARGKRGRVEVEVEVELRRKRKKNGRRSTRSFLSTRFFSFSSTAVERYSGKSSRSHSDGEAEEGKPFLLFTEEIPNSPLDLLFSLSLLFSQRAEQQNERWTTLTPLLPLSHLVQFIRTGTTRRNLLLLLFLLPFTHPLPSQFSNQLQSHQRVGRAVGTALLLLSLLLPPHKPLLVLSSPSLPSTTTTSLQLQRVEWDKEDTHKQEKERWPISSNSNSKPPSFLLPLLLLTLNFK